MLSIIWPNCSEEMKRTTTLTDDCSLRLQPKTQAELKYLERKVSQLLSNAPQLTFALQAK